MKTFAAIALVMALAAPLSGGVPSSGQTGSCRVPCMHDWRRETARLGEPALQRMGNRIADQCADSARIDFSGWTSNPRAGWDGLIADAQQQIRENGFVPSVAAWARALLRLAQDEKAHLAQGLADCARGSEIAPERRPTVAPPDATRGTPLQPLLDARGSRGFSYDLDPVYRSWVPAYVKRMLDARYADHSMHVECSGPVWIQRGDRRVSVAGNFTNLQLRPGDIIATGKGGRVRVSSPYSSRDIVLGENSTVGIGQDVACLTTTEYPTGRMGYHLITGTLYWLATGSRLQVNCAVLTTRDFALSVRGTQFSITTTPGAGTDEISIEVTEGIVDVEDRQGRTAAVSAGESRRYSSGFSTMEWTIANECSRSVDLRLFDETNNLQWPADTSKVWFIDPGQTLVRSVSCVPGAKICYGGAAAGQTVRWGVGINGREGCSDCCQTCGAADQTLKTSRRLTCRVPGAVR